MKNVVLFLIAFLSSITFAGSDVALSGVEPVKATKKCEEALFARGDQWMKTHHSPLAAIHPGFSKTAEHLYFYLDEPCLEIFLQQGPYGGSHMGANKIERFYLNYNPGCYPPWSFYRQMFGSEKIEIHLKDGDFSAYYDESLFERHEIMQIRIPRQTDSASWDLSKAVQLIISRDTGMVYGYGPKVGRVKSFFKDVWSEIRAHRVAKRGVWYNSNSGMPLPQFYQGVLERESKQP